MIEMDLFHRWLGTLRSKAAQYEHTARARGEEVTTPCLDDVCNEIEAYLVGRGLWSLASPPPLTMDDWWAHRAKGAFPADVERPS